MSEQSLTLHLTHNSSFQSSSRQNANRKAKKLALLRKKHTNAQKSEPMDHSSPQRTAHMSMLMTGSQMQCTIQHWTVLIIFGLILQTISTARMLSIGWRGT